MTRPLFVMVLALLLGCCSKSTDIPKWLQAKIDNAPIDPSVPAHVARYRYNGNTVYYLSPQAPDGFGCLFDTNGQALGCPDGGMDGNGDGTHSGFFVERSDEKILWKTRK